MKWFEEVTKFLPRTSPAMIDTDTCGMGLCLTEHTITDQRCLIILGAFKTSGFKVVAETTD